MSQRVQKTREHVEDKKEEVTEPPLSDAEQRQKHLDDIDAMLDEIDEVLESEAENFVRDFVQKGGQMVNTILRLTRAHINAIVSLWNTGNGNITTRRWL